jgi:hypothetical protein
MFTYLCSTFRTSATFISLLILRASRCMHPAGLALLPVTWVGFWGLSSLFPVCLSLCLLFCLSVYEHDMFIHRSIPAFIISFNDLFMWGRVWSPEHASLQRMHVTSHASLSSLVTGVGPSILISFPASQFSGPFHPSVCQLMFSLHNFILQFSNRPFICLLFFTSFPFSAERRAGGLDRGQDNSHVGASSVGQGGWTPACERERPARWLGGCHPTLVRFSCLPR